MDALTLIHVLLSLIGIVAGFVVAAGMLGARRLPGWTRGFLVTTIATSATGFLFPFKGFTPALGFGVISLLVLPLSVYALYVRKLSGPWRLTYVYTALFAQYLNFFVLIVQLFLKVPALKALAPKGTEPPFAITQALALILFIYLGVRATSRFRPEIGPRSTDHPVLKDPLP